ncbi:cold shock and DUF1294 domain-containing protein [Colwellia asteriadis]|uniref:Cold shock and DUF1294 domain-containing protein n=1 Tax=Colwellia asteriadis TaxID=517723 RepID=A0ABN1L6B2_9GAMM
MRLTGKLLKWSEDKCFGFIVPNGGGDHVFIHKSAFSNKKRTPQVNDILTFSIAKDKQGRYCADKATFAGEKPASHAEKHVNKFSIYLAVLFLGAILVALIFGYLPINLVLLYLGASTLCFVSYAHDKNKAKRGAWRTPESTLHLLALAGGWPGAAIAQQTLRHKSKKATFRFVFWLTVIINISALCWLTSLNQMDESTSLLKMLFS